MSNIWQYTATNVLKYYWSYIYKTDLIRAEFMGNNNANCSMVYSKEIGKKIHVHYAHGFTIAGEKCFWSPYSIVEPAHCNI